MTNGVRDSLILATVMKWALLEGGSSYFAQSKGISTYALAESGVIPSMNRISWKENCLRSKNEMSRVLPFANSSSFESWVHSSTGTKPAQTWSVFGNFLLSKLFFCASVYGRSFILVGCYLIASDNLVVLFCIIIQLLKTQGLILLSASSWPVEFRNL